MRFALGLLTGAVCAAATVMWLPLGGPDDWLAVVSDVGAGGVARVEVPRANEQAARTAATSESIWPRFFGLSMPVPEPERKAPAAVAAAPPASSVWSVTSVDVAPSQAARNSTPSGHVVQPVATPVVLGAALPRELSRFDLVRDLQRELKRVGCYGGEVDGQWGPGTRRGIQAFMERVNSALPSEEPDLIQLTLVRGYSGAACAGACPADRVSQATGRCLPATTTAQRPAAPTVTASSGDRYLAAPMAVSTPLPMREAPRPAAPVVAAGAGPAMATAQVAAPAAVVPLEGRMSVGGPPVPGLDAPAPGAGADAPLVDTPVKPQMRAKPQPRPVTQRRSDRNWTGTFFNN